MSLNLHISPHIFVLLLLFMALCSFTVSLITYTFLNFLHTNPESSFIHLSSFFWTSVHRGHVLLQTLAINRMEHFVHRVSINSGSLNLSHTLCEVDVLLAQFLCGSLRMKLSRVYTSYSTELSAHKPCSVLPWSSSYL